MQFSGMWRRVDLERTGVSEERVVSIFWVEKYASRFSMHFSALKIEATRSSETSIFTRATRRHIPEV
jgi:hypothetical protein